MLLERVCAAVLDLAVGALIGVAGQQVGVGVLPVAPQLLAELGVQAC